MRSMATKWCAIFAVVVGVSSLAGCSAVSLVYGQASWLVGDYLAALADLDQAQHNALVKQMESVHQWHRRSELPEYAGLLNDAISALDGGLTMEETQALYGRGLTHYQRLLGKVSAGIAPVYVNLRAEQIVTLEDNLNERDADFKEQYASTDLSERKEKRRERILERVENVIDDLSDAQKAMLATKSDAFPDSGPLWYDYRVVQQIRFLALLKEKRDAGTIRQHLQAWLVDGTGRGERLTQYSAKLKHQISDLIVSIVESLDASQRRTLIQQLTEYRDLVVELSRETKA
jgi:hypothetical protein